MIQYGGAVLEKDQAILFGLRLVLNHLSVFESIIIALQGYTASRSFPS